MRLNIDVAAAASERIDRKQGAILQAPLVATAAVALSDERLARVTRYINESRSSTDTFALERAIGTNDLVSLFYLWSGIRASRSVARIVIAPGGSDPGGYATGFMVGPNLLITNHHVFPDAETAGRSRAQFAYEADAEGNERISTWFSFAPDRLFVNDETLDYALIAVNPDSKQGPDSLTSFGWLRLNPQPSSSILADRPSSSPSARTRCCRSTMPKNSSLTEATRFAAPRLSRLQRSLGRGRPTSLWEAGKGRGRPLYRS